MKVLVCMQHNLTAEQREELDGHDVQLLKDVEPELFASLAQCGPDVLALARDFFTVLMGKYAHHLVILPIGSPAFQTALGQFGIHHYAWAHTKRESVDVPLPDGGVRKTAVFRHEGFFDVAGRKVISASTEVF